MEALSPVYDLRVRKRTPKAEERRADAPRRDDVRYWDPSVFFAHETKSFQAGMVVICALGRALGQLDL
jgi:hypothetical protein